MGFLFVSGSIIVGLAVPASATPTPDTLSGYRQIGRVYYVPAGAQATGLLRCPAGSELVGGGATAPNTDNNLGENINSSIPTSDHRGWRARINNPGGSEESFAVAVVCVSGLQRYSVVTGTPVDNPAGTVTAAEAVCPSGTVVYSGGGSASSRDTAVNLVRSFPASPTAWRTDAGNASTGDDTVTAYAICAKKTPGYQQVVGAPVGVRPGQSVRALVRCPAGATALGGGASSTTGSPLAALWTTVPGGRDVWAAAQNNQSSSRDTITVYAVCTVVD